MRQMPVSFELAVAWLLLVTLIALFADVLAPSHALQSDLRTRLNPPVFFGGDWAHPLGTDQLGRDIWFRLVLSIETSLLIAQVGTVVGAVLGTVLGMLAAGRRGFIDEIIMVFVDAQAALPFLIVALVVVAVFGNAFWLFVLVVGVYGWERYARIARGMTMSTLEEPFIAATRQIGAGPMRIYAGHILPNIGGALIVTFTINFPETLLLETTLSFLGLGIQPPGTSLGTMIGEGRAYLSTAWWIAAAPGIMIAFTSLAACIIGDALQDRLAVDAA